MNLERGEVNIKTVLVIIGVTLSIAGAFFWEIVIPIRDVQTRVAEIQVTLQTEHDNYAALDKRVTALEKK